MAPETLFWFGLLLKMAVAAGFVIAATVIAERAGAFIGSLIVTLPVSTGPAYIFVALDHDADFVARAASASVANNVPTLLYTALFIALAQRYNAFVSVGAGLCVWFLATFLFSQMAWPLVAALALNVAVTILLFVLVRRFREAPMPRMPQQWFDLLLRAALVSLLIAAVVSLSYSLGPEKTGLLASFPVTFTSTMFILHRRVGGPATAAVMAHSLLGLLGFGFCMAVLSLAAIPVGAPFALLLALLFSLCWNAAILLLRRYRAVL